MSLDKGAFLLQSELYTIPKWPLSLDPSERSKLMPTKKPKESTRETRGLRMTIVVTIFALGLLTAACGSSTNAGGDKEVTIKWSWALPNDSVSSKQTVKAIGAIEDQSDGQIKVKQYPEGQLFGQDEVTDAVINHSVEMATISLHRWVSFDPALGIDGVPFLIDDMEALEKATDGPFSDLIGGVMEEEGVKLVGWTAGGYGGGFGNSKHPVKVPSDFAGLRMRAGSTIDGEIYKKFGAQGLEMDSADVYTAIERGTINGASSGVVTFLQRDWASVAPYITSTRMSTFLYPVVANLEWWKGLTNDQQNWIEGSVETTKGDSFSGSEAAEDAIVKQLVDEKDAKVYQVEGDVRNEWKEELASFFRSEYLKEAGELGKQLVAAYEEAKSSMGR